MSRSRFWMPLIVYLGMIVVGMCFAAPSSAQDKSIESLRALALQLVNKSRAKQKLPPLRLETKLTKAAQFHADDMLRRNFYSHTSPEGKSVSDRFQAAGGDRWVLTAENIAKCEPCGLPLTESYIRDLHEGWMNSPGHRANILRDGVEIFGFGITTDKNDRLYAVQTFAGPGTSRGAGPIAKGKKPLSTEQQAEAALRDINKRRKSAGRPPLAISKALNEAIRAILPKRADKRFAAAKLDDIYNALPKAERKNWKSLSLLQVACGGCGVQPVPTDIAFFMNQWFGEARYERMLLSEKANQLGFAIAANGEGKKVALGLLGERR